MQYNITDPATRTELLQRMLRYLALAKDLPGLLVSVDGVYNEETRQAVRNFQQSAQIPVTGITDLETWNAVAAMYTDERDLRMPVLLRVIPDDRDFASDPGERSDTVLILQVLLGALRRIYDYPAVPLSGVYGPQTADAVREIQRIAGMAQTGRADRQTWRRIAEEYEGGKSE
ncbi:MAG: peptidoglycan-binding protein [Clostridia bacterium]|nr:peptidoglycan-binding protein [Clostridia bacterium]